MKLLFAKEDLRLLIDPARFERGRQVSATIEDLYQDEWSLVGTVLDAGTPYQAMVHHGSPPLAAECDCSDGQPPLFCEHSVAVGLSYIDADDI